MSDRRTIPTLGTDATEFLLERIELSSSFHNEMVSDEWRKYLTVKDASRLDSGRLEKLADPRENLTYGFYARRTNEIPPFSHRLYDEDPLYQRILDIREPEIGQPPKIFEANGKKVSGNFLRQAYFAYKLLHATESVPTLIVEFGGGYGLLAYLFKTLYPESRYVIVDIPESIVLQHYFLSRSFDQFKIGHIADHSDKTILQTLPDVLLAECNALQNLDISPDAVLALASFQEMNASTIDAYVSWTEKNIAPSGCFYLYNCHGLDEKGYAEPFDMMFDSRWAVKTLDQATLMPDDFHHLEVILQRQDATNSRWTHQKQAVMEFYRALSSKDKKQIEDLRRIALTA